MTSLQAHAGEVFQLPPVGVAGDVDGGAQCRGAAEPVDGCDVTLGDIVVVNAYLLVSEGSELNEPAIAVDAERLSFRLLSSVLVEQATARQQLIVAGGALLLVATDVMPSAGGDTAVAATASAAPVPDLNAERDEQDGLTLAM